MQILEAARRMVRCEDSWWCEGEGCGGFEAETGQTEAKMDGDSEDVRSVERREKCAVK